MPPHKRRALEALERHVRGVAYETVALESEISDLTEGLEGLCRADGDFLELGNFEGYATFHFFQSMGSLLHKSFSPALERLHVVKAYADNLPASQEARNPFALQSLSEQYVEATKISVEIMLEGILPFEKIVKLAYQRALDQFRYLQKRFLNLGVDETRKYRSPWEDEDGGFDYGKLPYVKIELVRDNALLTDLLLDVAEHLPRELTRRKKVKGRRKPALTKYVDPFDVDRAARAVEELAHPVYQGYLKEPRVFLAAVGERLAQYYHIMSRIEPRIRALFEAQNLAGSVKIVGRNLSRSIANPAPILRRLEGINYLSVQPSEEDVRPTGAERHFFAARKRLLEHLADSLDIVASEEDAGRRHELAKAAVERAIALKAKMLGSQQTRRSAKLERDKKTENEFYVGATQGFGQFVFEREPAPAVRLRDVYGKSFDAFKRHLLDLAQYSKFSHVVGVTAPRGKIRSNLIAIGPYGCGKTEIGRAIAGDPRFIGAEVSVTDALTCMFGEFEKNIDRIWDGAKELRRAGGDSKLVFLLMDEFDSWFSNTQGHWVDTTYNRVQKAIQMKLDGVVDYEGVITVGFTNEPGRIPLAIYRRFKYVDIVGELEPDERVALLKKFLSAGLPLSRGFSAGHYLRWGGLLEGATGDVIGKVTDDLHFEFMRKYLEEHPREGARLNGYIRRKSHNGSDLDKAYIKRQIGQHLQVTPDWVEAKVVAKLAEPIIVEQIETAQRVYREAREVLANLHRRQDDAAGSRPIPIDEFRHR